MDSGILKERAERLKSVRIVAPAWQDAARDRLLDYYAIVLPLWPEDRVKLLPISDCFTEPHFGCLSTAESDRVDLMFQSVCEILENAVGWSWVDCTLVKLVLTCAVLSEKGELPLGEDPSEPLLQFYEERFSLGLNHGCVDIFYRGGFTSVLLPTREAIARRVLSRKELQSE